MKKILCICLSATYQRTVTFKNLELEKVNRSLCYRLDASGKAINSARVLNQLEEGCVEVLCPLGVENAKEFSELCQRDKIPLSYVTIPGKTRTCWTLLDKEKGTTTELVVSEPDINHFDKEKIQIAEVKLLKYLTERLPELDAVILAGSRPKCWSEDLYSAICGIVKDKNVLFLADYIGPDLIKTIDTVPPDIIKINEDEYINTFGLTKEAEKYTTIDFQKHIIDKSRELNNIIIVTRGSSSTYAANKGEFFECNSEKVKAINTTACGDSFNSGFLYEFINSKDMNKSLEKGTWCAARNAESESPGSLY